MKKRSRIFIAVLVFLIVLPAMAFAATYDGYVNGLEVNASGVTLVMINSGPNGSGSDIRFCTTSNSSIINMLMSLQASQLKGYFDVSSSAVCTKAGAWMSQQP